MNKFYFDLLTLRSEMKYREYSISTQNTYYKTVKEFLETTDKDVIDIKREDIIRFLDSNLRLFDVNTILVKLSALEFFFSEILGIDIANNIRKYKREFKTKDFLTQEQLNILVNSVVERSRLLYRIIIETGMTLEELHLLKAKDLKLGSDNKLGTYIITRDLAREVTDYIEKNYIESYIFYKTEATPVGTQALRHLIRTETKDIFGKSYSANDIRHSVALDFIKCGYEKKACKYLKNESVSSIRQYYKRAGYDYMGK